MWCLCLASYPTLPTLDNCMLRVVLCMCSRKTVCMLGGGGTYVYACIKCVGCYECVCHAPPNPLIICFLSSTYSTSLGVNDLCATLEPF